MPDKDADTELRAVTFADAKRGLQFRAGHPVVVIITDIHATRRRVRGKKVIRGTFRVGDHIMKAATFRLHKDSGDGPLVTPESLAGGKTELRWAGDHWVTGDDGKYRFTKLAEGRYFVELIAKESGGES